MVAVPLAPASLVADVASGASVVLGYPAGFEQADFSDDYASATGAVAINANDIYTEAGGEVVFTYGASTISVRNDTGLTWPAGAWVLAQAAYATPSGVVGGGGAPVVLPDNMLLLADGETPVDGDLAVFGAEVTELRQGPEFVEEVLAAPSDVAAGVDQTLGTNIAANQFWRLRQTVTQANPLNLNFVGSSVVPSDTNHTLNVRVEGITASVPWQVEGIADGLEDVEGKITFVNGEGNANDCFPQDHASAGASVGYVDGVVESDLVVPTGSGSRLTVFFRIVTTGAAGAFEITGFEKVTA